MVTDAEKQTNVMRFREDILTPLSDRASAALNELKHALQSAGKILFDLAFDPEGPASSFYHFD